MERSKLDLIFCDSNIQPVRRVLRLTILGSSAGREEEYSKKVPIFPVVPWVRSMVGTASSTVAISMLPNDENIMGSIRQSALSVSCKSEVGRLQPILELPPLLDAFRGILCTGPLQRGRQHR